MPTTDALGNSKAGIKTPDMSAPLGTYASYNLRSSGYVAGQQAALTIAYLPLAVTKASKSSADPRKSVEDLYGSRANYVSQVNKIIDQAVADGLLLSGFAGVDDAADYKIRAQHQSIQSNFMMLP